MKRIIGFGLILVLVLASVAFGEINERTFEELSLSFYGAGAREMALGSSGVGLANDVSGGTWNPAGIWVLERPIIAASFQLYSPNSEYNISLNKSTVQNRLDLSGLGQFSFAAPVRIKGHPYVLNFNYNKDNEFTDRRRFDYENTLFILQGATLFVESGMNSSEQKAFLRTYDFGFSTRLYRQLSFGAQVNIYDGRRLTEGNERIAWSARETPPYPEGQLVQYTATGTVIDSTTSNGFNFTLGAMYKLNKLSIGAVVRTPFQMKHSTDRSAFRVITRNELPTRNSDTSYVNDSIAKLDIPIAGAIGFAYNLTPNLLAALDVNYQKYSSTKWYYREETFFSASGDRNDIFEPTLIGWKDAFGVGGGVEYMITAGFGKIPVRAGLRTDLLPQPKDFLTTYRPYIQDFNGSPDTTIVIATTASGRQKSVSFSLGTGIHWSLIQLDFAYRYTSGTKATLVTDVYGSDPYKQTFKRKSHEFKGTFTGYF